MNRYVTANIHICSFCLCTLPPLFHKHSGCYGNGLINVAEKTKTLKPDSALKRFWQRRCCVIPNSCNLVVMGLHDFMSSVWHFCHWGAEIFYVTRPSRQGVRRDRCICRLTPVITNTFSNSLTCRIITVISNSLVSVSTLIQYIYKYTYWQWQQ